MLSNFLPMFKVYTKAGDDGKTQLIGSKRFKKSSPIIHAVGELDEVNSFVGWASCACGEGEKEREILETLRKVQKDLHLIGSEIAGADFGQITEDDVSWLERVVDRFYAGKKVGNFVRPGAKGELSARLHVCRSSCRRAERAVCKALPSRKAKNVFQYLNRLSDLLFVMGEC